MLRCPLPLKVPQLTPAARRLDQTPLLHTLPHAMLMLCVLCFWSFQDCCQAEGTHTSTCGSNFHRAALHKVHLVKGRAHDHSAPFSSSAMQHLSKQQHPEGSVHAFQHAYNIPECMHCASRTWLLGQGTACSTCSAFQQQTTHEQSSAEASPTSLTLSTWCSCA